MLEARHPDPVDRARRRWTSLWIPVHRRWRLNERHYGALQGLNKAETAAKHGDEQVQVWRRSYDTPPPALTRGTTRRGRATTRATPTVDADDLPATECLKDTVERVHARLGRGDRARPSGAAKRVLIAAHGNSLRALVKHLDGISDEEIVGLNIPTGIPLVYELDDDLKPIGPPLPRRPGGGRSAPPRRWRTRPSRGRPTGEYGIGLRRRGGPCGRPCVPSPGCRSRRPADTASVLSEGGPIGRPTDGPPRGTATSGSDPRGRRMLTGWSGAAPSREDPDVAAGVEGGVADDVEEHASATSPEQEFVQTMPPGRTASSARRFRSR